MKRPWDFTFAILSLCLYALIFATSGCATLSDVTHEAEVVDEGAKKLREVVKEIRAGVQQYAQLAVLACGESPLDVEACQELDFAAVKLYAAFKSAEAALDLYDAGKGDFIDAYEAAGKVLELAEDYAQKVVALVERARA